VSQAKKVLMVAFHYPPYGGGSGIHRTLKFSRYLSEFGWQPIVLTISPHAYPRREKAEPKIPAGVVTARAFALDTARHLSFRGSYPQWMALPDRWVSWWPSAVGIGAGLIRKHRPDMIWSTYPIATAHMIGLALHRWSGVPWVADFRDPMVEKDPITGEEHPRDPLVRKVSSWIEERTVKSCSRAVFTTPGTLGMYADRFPEVRDSQWAVIANGYDEEDFASVEVQNPPRLVPAQPAVLLHSGVLYPFERDPMPFFQALAELRRLGKISPSTLKVVLRATGHDELYREPLRNLGIADIVSLEPTIPHNQAVAEMLRAHGLLIFQATNSNRQIPAKAYECLRSGRPIFALTDPTGDTASLLKAEGVESIVPLDAKDEIAAGLMRFLQTLNNGRPPQRPAVERHSRKARTGELATLFDSVLENIRVTPEKRK
jgi:glycosyltransferase involved in cell wall biosynthesis